MGVASFEAGFGHGEHTALSSNGHGCNLCAWAAMAVVSFEARLGHGGRKPRVEIVPTSVVEGASGRFIRIRESLVL